jgi:DNA polymerase III delta prime subunit
MDYSFENAKFIFICNYLQKIIQPIFSRCFLFRFLPISNRLIFTQLKSIVNKESIALNYDIIQKITDFSFGDLRKAINTLQSICMIDTIQSIDDFCNLQGIPSKIQIEKIIGLINYDSFEKTCDYVQDLKSKDNFSTKDLFQSIFEKIKLQLQKDVCIFRNINQEKLKKIIFALQELEETISICIDSNTHLYALISIFYKYTS